MTRFKKKVMQTMALLGAACFFTGGCVEGFDPKKQDAVSATNKIVKSNKSIDVKTESFFDKNVVYELPKNVTKEQDVSVIVTMNVKSLVETYNEKATALELSEFVSSAEAKKYEKEISRRQNVLINKLKKSGIRYTLGERYDTILSGFEITVKAKDFEAVGKLFADDASVFVGETYLPAESKVVTNEVDVYETGIFDSSSSDYQGDGVVVAVLDTGLDYTHTAFSDANFDPDQVAFDLETVSSKISQTTAAKLTQGLTGEDVYVGRKVPFAYDYADKDPDVLPINSEHGTHVAGVIAGDDDTITGVAPDAQLAIMKVFSDTATGAKDSWILSALEDCVVLGVDVINMSLGSSCGFSREVDKEQKNNVYDKIREAGISLICAASNDYNATHGSEKNGSNGLTSNPDSGTVGAPSTYPAALSVASVDGVKTPYIVYEGRVMYFNEASMSDGKQRDFVDDLLNTLGDGVQSKDFEYVTIPGIGRSSDYPEESEFYEGKIVLVKRGQTTFEDKVRVALKEKGAAGIIIYNNVSGTISMSVGDGVGPVCSISQDEGELLAAAGTGILKVSRAQVAGPFMSDFSSWGPTSDLKIKPEITAHGGEILSAVPGQAYDRLSGTSMAAPNQAGAAALIRQYVKYSGDFGALEPKEVTDVVNQLMMSTADIVYNKNGLPYAVRKQGAGLVNISESVNSKAYLTTYDKEGNLMEKSKLELGDDKDKTGVYEVKFDLNNISDSTRTYEVGALIQTEGVSTTYTSHSDTTVTMDGYMLEGTKTTVTAVSGSGLQNGNKVIVEPHATATVSVQIVLSEKDKEYLENSFAHGMYVEGFVTLDAVSGATIDLNVPLLAFFGDWTEAPIFDEEYYDTHKDEINKGLDPEDKLMPDAYATRVIGSLYSDYISTLGTYYFVQNPAATQIAASKEHIALSNQEKEDSSALNGIYAIWAGLLRNVKEWKLTIVEDSTGKEIFSKTDHNQQKSRSYGSSMVQSSFDVDFKVLENDLKNNTKYTVTVETYIDYGAKAEQKNVRNVFEFPLFIDFEAPVITDVVYRSEYDKTTKKTKLYADFNVYDNHYAMGMQVGQITKADPDSEYLFMLNSFGKYMTPVYSSFNSTSKVTIELTDYIAQIKQSVGAEYDENGEAGVKENVNTFIATCYDYAMNAATYEIALPDDILSMYFTEDVVELSPNETKEIKDILSIYPAESWLQTLEFESSDSDTVSIVNQTIVAKKSGTATIKAIGRDDKGNKVETSVEVKVLSPEDDGYKGGYSIPEVNKFTITGYKTNKAYYDISSENREIGLTDSTNDFGGQYSLSMFPSESVTLLYTLDSYFPEKTGVTYTVGNSKIATVDENGTIVAQAEGTTIVTVTVTFDGKKTFYSGNVAISVKDPYTTNAIYLMSYKGLGGEVVIPGDRGITTIYEYAFSNYEYVQKDVDAGDVIDDEDPYNLKQMYIGEDTITKIVIPEGVTHINAYAFAKLTALEEVVLPTTLVNIANGAFIGCEKLKKINLENVKFINEKAFYGCALTEVKLDSVVAIGNYTFDGCKLASVTLPESSQSLGIGAFQNNAELARVEFKADRMKIGSAAFQNCVKLKAIDVNAAVISSYAFNGCSQLSQVKLGKEVAVIGEYAFSGTAVSKFTIDSGNKTLSHDPKNNAFVMNGDELVLGAPAYKGVVTTEATSIATSAFAGNKTITKVVANNVTYVGPYAFAGCMGLKTVEMDSLKQVDDFAFADTGLTAIPNTENLEKVGRYSFANTQATSVTIADNTVVGDYAFAINTKLTKVVVGNNVTLGEAAFYCPIETEGLIYNPQNESEEDDDLDYYKPYTYEAKDENGNVVKTYTYYQFNYLYGAYSALQSVTIGDNVTLGDYSFWGNVRMTTLNFGDGTVIGDSAFFNAAALESVDLSKAKSVGASAFSGWALNDYWLDDKDNVNYAVDRHFVDGKEVYSRYEYSELAPCFETLTLTKVQSFEKDGKVIPAIGEGAFAYNEQLKKVVIGNNVTEIMADTFNACLALSDVTFQDNIVKIGNYAFYNTLIEEADLTSVDYVGEYAFSRTKLEEVALKAGSEIGEGAFAFCEALATVDNLEDVAVIGASAFRSVALTEITLTNATYVGDFAFGYSKVTKVNFGDKLKELGENPFIGCEIETFGKLANVEFGGAVVGQEMSFDYDVSETVKVIGGVLYQIVPNGGLELISYPMANKAGSYVVEANTIRISAGAFVRSALRDVTLSKELKAIGDKAFFECEDLAVVIFKSYDAPALEEAYDESIVNLEFMAMTGNLAGYEGLGIAPYYMWNATSSPSNYYFGANFVNYIGKIENKLTMVRPSNGKNYETFIFAQYFDTIVAGSNATIEVTDNVIALIEGLPASASVNLADEEKIVEARKAYDALPSIDQQALVSNYEKLVSAERALTYLKSIQPKPEQPKVEKPNAFVSFLKENVVGIVIAAVAIVGSAAFVVVTGILRKKKFAVAANVAETEGTEIVPENVEEAQVSVDENVGEDENKKNDNE